MDTSSQWPQGIGIVKGVDETKLDQKKPRPQKEQAVNCPRCNSTNTKFCYYNNYSLTQPRYFCKTCRRYWTEGGSLRNVPVGGGSRKNKRSNNININSSSSSSSTTSSLSLSSSKKLFTDLANPNDLNLTYNPIPSISTSTTATNFSNFSDFMALPLIHPSANSASTFMPSSTLYPSSTTGLSNLHDLKGSNGINFSLDGFENGYGSLQGSDHQEAKLFFPMDDLKINVSTVGGDEQFEENRGQAADQSNGFWNGMLGGGGTSW